MIGGQTFLCSVQRANTVLSTIQLLRAGCGSSYKKNGSYWNVKKAKKMWGVIETCIIGTYKNLYGQIISNETNTALITSA